jgi:hypothetical protein
MTARDGFPRHMDPFALDAQTAERLVTGAVDVGDAPPQYQGVATAFQALREAPDSSELLGASAVVDRIAAAIALERRARRSRRSRRSATRVARLAAAFVVACGVALTGGLAAAGALPESAQGVASAVLSRVGISVPTGGDEKPADDQAPPSTSIPAPPPTTSSVTQPPSANGSDVPLTAPSTPPHTNSQGESPGTRSRGTPPSTANGKGKGQAPDDAGTPNTGNGQGNRR